MARERILVADDSAENREFIITYILRPNQFESLEAKDGIECMELARRAAPDLILLDFQMPRLDGRGVLEALRRENLNIPVILMTFHGSEEIAVEVFRMGVRDYVKKPYTLEEMLQAIENSLTETRLRKEKEALTARLLNANRELHNRVKELNTLYGIGKSVTALLDPALLLTRIVEAAGSVTNAEQGSLILVEGNQMTLRAVKRRNEPHARPMNEPTQDRLAERAAESGVPVSLSPQELAPMRQRNPNAPLAVMFVPIKLSNRVIGVIGIENVTNARPFTDHDGALLSALGDYAAIAIENARNFQQLEEIKEREKTAIRSAFERYVSPSVVDRVLRTGDTPGAHAQRREVSVLVADLRGYSTAVESLSPDQVIETLNGYFTLAADVIFTREGSLDKSSGDAFMAFFNAPEPQEDHPYRILEAAVALQNAAMEANRRRGGTLVTFGIGVALGEAVIGSIGTQGAMNYTVIGEVVNVAKRLQERAEPGQILVEESLINRVRELAEAERLGELQIRGKRAPVVGYALKSLK